MAPTDTSLPLLEFIVDRVNVGIVVVDPDMKVVLWNQFMEMNSNTPTEAIVGANLFDTFPDLPRKWLEKKIKSVFVLKNFAFTSWEQRPYLFQFRHNRPVTGGVDYMQQNCTFLPIKGNDDNVEYVCITVFDVTDTSIYQKMLEGALNSLEEMSVRDGLTGIYNRHYLEKTLETEFDRVRRYGGVLSLLLLDVDFFKKVNDTYGHQAGDAVLKDIAARMQTIPRNSDTVGRYGGEEFTLLLPNTSLEGACTLAERLRKIIADQPVKYRDLKVDVTVSIGVTQIRDETENYERLLNEADQALYKAKETGRNRVVRFHP